MRTSGITSRRLSRVAGAPAPAEPEKKSKKKAAKEVAVEETPAVEEVPSIEDLELEAPADEAVEDDESLAAGDANEKE